MMRLFLLILSLTFAGISNAAAAVDDELRELGVTVVTTSPLVGKAALLVSGNDNKTHEWFRSGVLSSTKEGGSYKTYVSFLINASAKKNILGIRFTRPGEVNVSLHISEKEWSPLFNLTD